LRLADFLRLLSLSAIWGASFLFLRLIAPVLGALPTAFFRTLLASLGLVGILLLMRQRFDFKGKTVSLVFLGAITSGLPFFMYGFAAKILPAGYSAILNATTPLMGVVIGALFFSEHLTASKAAGVLVGLGGVALLTQAGPVAISTSVLLAIGACLISTACYGLGGFLARRWITDKGGLDSKLVALGSQAGAAAVLLPVVGVDWMLQPSISWGGPLIWIYMAILALICTALAYILYFRLLADIGPIRSSTVTFLIPIFGVLWGALFLDEQFSWAHISGGMVIGLAVWLVLRPAK